MAGPLVERFRARCNSHPEPVCTPAFQTLVLPPAPADPAAVSALFPISDQNRGDCYQRAVDISRASSVTAVAGHGQYEGLRGFAITLPTGQTPSFDMVAISSNSIGYGGHSSNQPLYFGNPMSRTTTQTTPDGRVVEWLHRGGDMPMAISREVNGDQTTYRVWFLDQATSSQRAGIIALSQPDGTRRYSMVALDRIPPPPAPEVTPAPVVAPPPRPVERPAVVRPPLSDAPLSPAVPAPPSDVPPSDRPLTTPTRSLADDPFSARGIVDAAGRPFELREVTAAVAQRFTELFRTTAARRDGLTHVALDERHHLIELPRTPGTVPQDYLLVENRGTAETPVYFAASVQRDAAGGYRRNGEGWQFDFGAVTRAVARARQSPLHSLF